MEDEKELLVIAMVTCVILLVFGLYAMWVGNDLRAIALFVLALIVTVWGQ